MSQWTERDFRFMRRAIQLSRRGYPAPNPHVGCVLTHGEIIVGEGYHHHAGGNHAEVEALLIAGPHAMGSTAYVTLEPCNHHGRTPPCTEALIQAGVIRVVVACLDPNSRAAGGLEKLSQAGVLCEVGLLREDAVAANGQFLDAMRLKRPRIVLKSAMSLDGRIALPSGESKWLTGPEARRAGHRLRAECGAVLVGRRTVEADDPHLSARLPGVVNQPVRIVLDPSARLGPNWKVFDDNAETIHIVDGALGLRSGSSGFDLGVLCHALFERGINGLLVEGGALTLASFVRAGLFERVELFVAPKLLGAGPSWLSYLGVETLDEAPQLSIVSLRKLKADVQVSLKVETRKLTRRQE